MEATVASIRERLGRPWLVGMSPEAAFDLFDKALASIGDSSAPVLLAEGDPSRFLFGFLASIGKGNPVVLASAQWPAALWADVPDMHFDTVLGAVEKPQCRSSKREPSPGSIFIATGGSGGKLRFAVHTWQSLSAGITGYRKFFEKQAINCVSLLPLHHVGGLMPCLRTFVTGGQLLLGDWKAAEAGVLPKISFSESHISLVPTQLSRLLQTPGGVDWLRGFEAVLIGGGPSSQPLLSEAQRAGIPLYVAYGMTETAGTIALQLPEALKHNGEVWGLLLPHLEAQIDDGEILLKGESLSSGFWGSTEACGAWFYTGDEGRLDKGRLTVSGRKGRWINTGGEKVDPQLLEAEIVSAGFCRQVVVLGLPDADWGESVAALLVGAKSDENALLKRLRDRLPAFMLPKTILWGDEIPKTSVGKTDYQAVKAMLSAAIASELKK